MAAGLCFNAKTMPPLNILKGSAGDPEPEWRAPVLTGFFAGLILIGLIMPVWFGRPLNAQSVRLYCDAKTRLDCCVDRAVTVLRKVYDERHFEVVERPLNDQGCGGDVARIDLVRERVPGAAHSWIENGCRFVGIDPDNPSFSSHTLAHEFGHHCFGDVGLSVGFLTPLFNMVFDMRNDLIITASL
jgi:hypothetical protein